MSYPAPNWMRDPSRSAGGFRGARRALSEAARIAARSPLRPVSVGARAVGFRLSAQWLARFIGPLGWAYLGWELYNALEVYNGVPVAAGGLDWTGWNVCGDMSGELQNWSGGTCAQNGVKSYTLSYPTSKIMSASNNNSSLWFSTGNPHAIPTPGYHQGYQIGRAARFPAAPVPELPPKWMPAPFEEPAWEPAPDREPRKQPAPMPVHPALDPFELPITQPVPDWEPLPLTLPRPNYNPWRAPNEQPQRGPGPRPAMPALPRTAPAVSPSVEGQPGPSYVINPAAPGLISVLPPTNAFPRPPGRGEKERKIQLKVNLTVHRIVGGFTELVEVVDCLYANVPKLYKDIAKRKAGRKRGKPRLPEKTRAIYDGFAGIDWTGFNKCFARNLVEDLTYGGGARLQAKALQKNPYYKRPVSPSFGQRYWPRAGGHGAYSWEDFWSGVGLHDVFY